jgi:hypothetical protein
MTVLTADCQLQERRIPVKTASLREGLGKPTVAYNTSC